MDLLRKSDALENARQDHQHLQHCISHTMYSVLSWTWAPTHAPHKTKSWTWTLDHTSCHLLRSFASSSPHLQDAASRDLSVTLLTLPCGTLSAFPLPLLDSAHLPRVNTAVASGLIFSLSVHFQNQSDIIFCLNILHAQFVSSPRLLQSSDAHIRLALGIFSSVSYIL